MQIAASVAEIGGGGSQLGARRGLVAGAAGRLDGHVVEQPADAPEGFAVCRVVEE